MWKLLLILWTVYQTGANAPWKDAPNGDWRGYGVSLVINVTMTTSPLVLEFDACQVLQCGAIIYQRWLSKHHKYLCPSIRNPEYYGGLYRWEHPPCSFWDEVWWTTEPGGWTASVPSRKFPKLTQLKPKISLSMGNTSANCQLLQCNPLLLIIQAPLSLFTEPRVASRMYGLGADVSGTDPIGKLVLRFIQEPIPTSVPNNGSTESQRIISKQPPQKK